MKKIPLLSVTAITLLLATGCDRQSAELSKQLADLERTAAQAVERQQELQQEVEDQRLAAEREAIERERMQIEQDRLDLQREQGEIAAAESAKLQQRETELAQREGSLERLQATLEEQQAEISEQVEELGEKDREIAGREAIPFKNDEVQTAPVADYGTFYDSLSPYGSWFETQDYGYVWQPAVIRDRSWRPYTRGRWACTDRGWTWVSDEPFGWATYHYGRWSLLRGRGWVWVPGSEWAPSWVSWRYSDSHVGWAPLPPESLAYRGGSWGSTVDVTFGIGAGWFNFVQVRNFCSPVRYHCLPYTNNHLYYGQCANVTNIYVQNNRVICGGPRYRDICDRIGRPVPFYQLDVNRHGYYGRDSLAMRPRIQGNRLRVAAPGMDVAWNDGLRPRRVQGRIDNLTVDRQQALRPEVSDRYRQSREQGRNTARQSIAQLGGSSQFNQQRARQLDANRRMANPASRSTAGSSGIARQSSKQTIAKVPQTRTIRQTASIGQGPRQPSSRTQTSQPRIPAPKPGSAKPAPTQTQSRNQASVSSGLARQTTPAQRPTTQTKTTPDITSARQSSNPLPKGVRTMADARKQQSAPSKLSSQRQVTSSRTQLSTPRIHPPKTSLAGKSINSVPAPRKQTALTGQSRQVSQSKKSQSTPRIPPPAQSNAKRQQQAYTQKKQTQARPQQLNSSRKPQTSIQRPQTQIRPQQAQYSQRSKAQSAPRPQSQYSQRSQPAPQRQQAVQRSQIQQRQPTQQQYRPQQSRPQSSQSNQRSQSNQQWRRGR